MMATSALPPRITVGTAAIGGPRPSEREVRTDTDADRCVGGRQTAAHGGMSVRQRTGRERGCAKRSRPATRKRESRALDERKDRYDAAVEIELTSDADGEQR